ncbi:hypothetical protein VAE122_3310005 [Vibrio aestuarianus]|nr:hypothetical protein VAE122_3310005 [Vibrio aestuarianus]
MSQTAIPLEFEQYLQNKVSLKQPTDLNEIIFAMIPDLDLSQPIDRTVSLPPLEQWVFQQDIDQIGKSGSNAVVYSVVIPGSTEPFTFNAMFLRDKNVPKSCGMVVYKATETKETGMALTKSMLMQFDGAAAAANVTIDAATWQIDYQARLKGMDEDHRLSCLDNYGHTAFVDGFDITRHEVDQTKYLIAPGVAYVGGLRIQNALSTVQTVDSKPTTLWVDVYRDGTALSQHENLFQIVATTDDLVEYTDSENRPHYLAKLARIEADGSIVDLRVKGGLAGHLDKSNAHPQYVKTEANQVENRLRINQNWNIPGKTGHPLPGATPRNYPKGAEIAFGIFAESGMTNVTYDNGLISADSGYYSIKVDGADINDHIGIKLENGTILEAKQDTVTITGVVKTDTSTGIAIGVSFDSISNIHGIVRGAHRFSGCSEQAGIWPNVSDEESARGVPILLAYNPDGWASGVNLTLPDFSKFKKLHFFCGYEERYHREFLVEDLLSNIGVTFNIGTYVGGGGEIGLYRVTVNSKNNITNTGLSMGGASATLLYKVMGEY